MSQTRRSTSLRLIGCIGALIAAPASGFAQQDQARSPSAVHEHVDVAGALLTPTRDASGSAWLPSATPMFGVHRPWRGWDVRLDGVASIQALYEPRDRHRTGGPDTRQFVSTNWFMIMGRRALGGGRFGVRAMLSAEPWTITDCGSLNFLATGEVCQGDTIHDRQQPHDLVMELAVDYERAFAGQWRWQVYAGLSGEPAFGPPGYPHRPSAVVNAIGPITHHWIDATHVTFGVLTFGVHNQRWKTEASIFNGRDPDERRYDLDLGRLDSVSARVSFLPTERLALQVSGARLGEARLDFPRRSGVYATRVTASAVYHRPLGANGIWATTVAVGANRAGEALSGGVLDAVTMGALTETSITLSGRHTIFGRGEGGGMPAHHLHANEFSTSVFGVGKIQLGYVRHLKARRGVVPGVGATGAISVLPLALAPRYGGRFPPSVGLFFIVQAARHDM